MSKEPAAFSPTRALRTALRLRMRDRRARLSAAERLAAAQALAGWLEEVERYRSAHRLAGYWAIDGELPLLALLPIIHSRGQIFHLPLLGADRRLRFAPWRTGEAIVVNRFGIPEPADRESGLLMPDELDVVLVPLVGFDRNGYRLGYGGGWYDRSFAFRKDLPAGTGPLLIGIGYARQEIDPLAPMPWDVPLDFVATEHELIDCRQGRMEGGED